MPGVRQIEKKGHQGHDHGLPAGRTAAHDADIVLTGMPQAILHPGSPNYRGGTALIIPKEINTFDCMTIAAKAPLFLRPRILEAPEFDVDL
jgi:hypothetical protein